ncbi:hypothetical protein EBS43_01745 [bacterium]|jgi:protein-disulfide isomerase|nr:hypothetical protein [bacterium]
MNSTSPKRLYFLNVAALVGCILSIILTQHYFSLRNGSDHFRSSCNVGQAFNCDVIAASPYSELASGIPLSSVGAGWFLGILILSLLAHSSSWRRESTRALLVATGSGLVVSLYYLSVMAFKLKTYCLFCLGVDAAALTTLITTLTLKPEGLNPHRLEPKKWKTFALTLLGSLTVMIVLLRGFDQSTSSADSGEPAESYLNSTPEQIHEDGTSATLGPKDAPITIVEFSDFQCPYCRIGALSLNSVLIRYPGKIRVIFRHFPLDQSCNSSVQHSAHPAACEAAKVAHCSHEQGAFEATYEGLFEKQSQLQSGEVANLLKSNSAISPSKLEQCMNSSSTALKISQDIQAGIQHKVEGTPTFFVNGYKIVGILPPQVWYKIIDHFLKSH